MSVVVDVVELDPVTACGLASKRAGFLISVVSIIYIPFRSFFAAKFAAAFKIKTRTSNTTAVA